MLKPEIAYAIEYGYIISHHHDPGKLIKVLAHILGIGAFVNKAKPTIEEQKQMVDIFAKHLKEAIDMGSGNEALQHFTEADYTEFRTAAAEAVNVLRKAGKL